ncbi:hypothetical protein NQ318_006985 [Aromia moschata]|uniref:Uncharacterized protein n=1 Tax=Aromia moschata TaxID=1265417 RepID=A0AAV8X407_9CUCU|nr:hypothetical protein NQ318_006985 [Aromia moschata]
MDRFKRIYVETQQVLPYITRILPSERFSPQNTSLKTEPLTHDLKFSLQSTESSYLSTFGIFSNEKKSSLSKGDFPFAVSLPYLVGHGMMMGYGDRKRIYQEVCTLFHELYPNRPQINEGYVLRFKKIL